MGIEFGNFKSSDADKKLIEKAKEFGKSDYEGVKIKQQEKQGEEYSEDMNDMGDSSASNFGLLEAQQKQEKNKKSDQVKFPKLRKLSHEVISNKIKEKKRKERLLGVNNPVEDDADALTDEAEKIALKEAENTRLNRPYNLDGSKVTTEQLTEDKIPDKLEKIKSRGSVEKSNTDYVSIARNKLGISAEDFEKSRQKNGNLFYEIMAESAFIKAIDVHGKGSEQASKAYDDLVKIKNNPVKESDDESIKTTKKEADLENEKEMGNGSPADFVGLKKENKVGTAESLEKENKPEKKTDSLEKLKSDADKLFKEVLTETATVQRLKNEMGKLAGAMNILGIGKNSKNEDNPVRKLHEAETLLAEKNKKYQNKYQEVANQIVENKRAELLGTARNELKQKSFSEMSNELKKYILTEKVVEGIEKNKEGEVEKFSLLEYANNNEKKLLAERTEALNEKKKGILKKMLERYKGLSKTKKLVYGVGISASLGAVATAAGGAGLSMALGYGAWKGGKTLLRRVVMGAALGTTVKGVDKKIGENYKKQNAKDKIKTDEQIANDLEQGDSDIFKVLGEYNKKEKGRATRKKVFVGATAVALFGTALGAEALLAGEIPADLDESNSRGVDAIDMDNLSEAQIKKLTELRSWAEECKVKIPDEDLLKISIPGGRYDMAHDMFRKKYHPDSLYNLTHSVMEKLPDNEKTISSDGKTYSIKTPLGEIVSSKSDRAGLNLSEKLDADFKETGMDQSEIQALGKEKVLGVDNDANEDWKKEVAMDQSDEQALETEESLALMNHDFELKKGDSVWGSLSEHFDGDKQAVGKVLAEFKEETVKDLVVSGMSEARANDFMDWRYRHMNVGVDFELKDGKLEISEFANEKMINQFETQNPVVEVVDDNQKSTFLEEDDPEARANGQTSAEEVDRKTDLLSESEETNRLTQEGDLEGDFEQSEVEKNQRVDQIINEKVTKIYDHWGSGNQIEEWDVMKDKVAGDILDKNYGDPIGNQQLDQAEINNREQLRDYLIQLISESGETPRLASALSPAETVEEFAKRVEGIKLSKAA